MRQHEDGRGARGGRFGIAAPHAAATAAGCDAYRRGGNAVDAALAAAAVLTVAYPHMCAVGGDVLALVREPDGRLVAVNGSGAAPAGLPPDAARDGVPQRGPLSITVPGAVAAWETLATRFGRSGLAAALGSAIALAADGVPVAPSLARSIASARPELAADPGAAEVFLPGGRPLAAGEQLVQPALAASLEELATDGAAALYRGALGHRLLEGLAERGSPLASGDLERHETSLEEPIAGPYGGHRIATLGPNSQGFVLLEILAALELAEVEDPLGADAPVLARLFALGARDRDRHLADPRAVEVPLERLLSAEHAAELARAAQEGVAASPAPAPPAAGDTVAVVAADGEGRAISLIQSLFHGFGSGILEPRTGILLHNRGACFAASGPNAMAPGRRPAHTLMPVLVLRGNVLAAAVGTMGGHAQAQIHAQLLVRLLARGESPAQAVTAPRFVVGGIGAIGRPVELLVEPGCGEARAAFAEQGMDVELGEPLDESVGHAHVVAVADGAYAAAADPRSDGAAATAR